MAADPEAAVARPQHAVKSCLALVLAAVLAASSADAEPLTGHARVIDGDSLDIAGTSVRLIGIDAPEGRQVCGRDGLEWRCGDDAEAALVALVDGQRVRCDVLAQDRYQRGLATCWAGEVELNRNMVRLGWAVAYYPARGVKGPLYDAEEAEAEAAQVGLWSGAFIRPDEWRRGVR